MRHLVSHDNNIWIMITNILTCYFNVRTCTDKYRNTALCSVSVVFVRSISKQLPTSLSLRINTNLLPFVHNSKLHSGYPPGGTTPLPVLKELVLSLKMWYWILANTGVGPYIQEQGLCTACTGSSLGDLGSFRALV